MKAETKWAPKKGDMVWAARFAWVGEGVDTSQAEVKSASAKQITLATSDGVFGYATRLAPEAAGYKIHATEIDALAHLVKSTREEAERAQRNLAIAEAALAKARGETP